MNAPAAVRANLALQQGFQLGEFSIEPLTGRVTGPAGHEMLDPKVMDVLVLLAQHARHVVLREDLLAQLWPNAVVTDDALSRCIYELRRQLSLAGGSEQYRAMLDTLPKRGYRLNADITLPSPLAPPAPPDQPIQPKQPNQPAPGSARTGSKRRWLALAVLIPAAALLWFALARPPAGPAAAGQNSIAVLPFADMSAEQDQGYLADGIAEEVRNRLAQSKELRVIARTSSFLFRDKPADVHDIAEKLDVSHVLEGSVRRSGDSLRISAQLVAASDSSQVWSMRFDRTAGDIFEIQDEIAMQVTRALELSLASGPMAQMTGQGTDNLEAYLEFLQGRSLLATNRVADARKAITRFEQAAALDSGFAAAYLGIAEAALYAAEFEVTEDRQSRFESARRRGETLVEKALSIDADNGEAYLQRAHLAAFEDLASAEKDYRRGLELSPNSAKGLAGLAAVLYTSPPRRDEALVLLDRARRLDPFEPAHDVAKAVFLYDELSDPEAARELMRDVVARNPQYAPALARLCESNFLVGDIAEGIRYCEQALALDPLLEESRRFLIHLYLLLGYEDIAEALVESPGVEPNLRALPLLIDRKDWRRAGEVAYRALERQTTSPTARWYACSAIRMQARLTGDYRRAVAVLQAESGVGWDERGNAVLPDEPTRVRDAAIALADILLQSGSPQMGHRLLTAILDRMRHEVGDLGRPEYWYVHFHPAALAMNREPDAAMAMLERAATNSAKPIIAWWQLLEIEPAFAELRDEPRFQAFRTTVLAHLAAQRRELERLRADGVVPDRTAVP